MNSNEDGIASGEGRTGDAVTSLTTAAERERALGYAFDAAAIELDLADALEPAGETERASALRTTNEAFLASIGCVNPL